MAARGVTRGDFIHLDGSEGEGGGQILRTALSASLITGRPFEIVRIRARRRPPGLRPQHLACVRGAEAITGGVATSEGAAVGTDRLIFRPGPVKAGDYLLEIGTAGSAPLLLQCLFFPLALAGGGTLTLRGGTHLPHSPAYHYLSWIWAPTMAAFGLIADLQLRYAGFYPKGAGEVVARILPRREPPTRVDLPARGTLQEVHVTSFVAGLSSDIAERQARAALALLRGRGIPSQVEKLPLPATVAVGTTVFVRAQFEHTAAGFSALGARGRPAEEVGEDAARQLAAFMETAGALDEHLADQILIPAALLAGGILGPLRGETRFSTSRVTDHLVTNARVLERFFEVAIAVDAASGQVRVTPKQR
ncbi:MAG: RNA 3'-phosphate cyclase [Myxococcaceae bacterium]|nr:RNA 3'-phosphate cyclase [Myxococcaceae bacterium]